MEGRPGREVRGVREHEHVGAQPLAVGAQELGEMQRADLLLALDEHLHVERQAARRVAPGAQRRHVEQQPRLVVDDAAAVEAPVAPQGRLEGRRLPALGPPRRLHVVVGVDEHRPGFGPGAQPFAVHRRMRARQAQQLDAPEPRGFEEGRHALGAALHLRRIEARRRDARDARERDEVGERALGAPLERRERVFEGARRHAEGRLAANPAGGERRRL